MDARLHWPGLGGVPVPELVLDTLLPIADEGLRKWGVNVEVRDRFLGVIEGRAKTGRNGARWQVSTVRALQDGGMTRPAALAEMLRRYCEHMHANQPVHTWELSYPRVPWEACHLGCRTGTVRTENKGDSRVRRRGISENRSRSWPH